MSDESSGHAGASVDQRRFLRDLTSLLALPAFWSGTDPGFVLRTFFEALEALLGLDVCFGSTTVTSTERLELLRVRGVPVAVADPAAAPILAFAAGPAPWDTRAGVPLPLGRVSCLRLPVGYSAEAGVIVVGATRAGFPNATEELTLRAALGLAAAGLETARVIRQRDEAQRAKDEFLAMLGHELRNPLAPIVTAIHLMALKSNGQPTREQQIIERQVQHLRRLVDDLLDVSRIARGKVEIHPERLALADVVARAIEAVMPAMEEAGHRVEVRVPGDLQVDADLLRLTQVVSNLLTNAAKYTPRGGRIEVTGERRPLGIALRVTDNGNGLSADLLPRVFDLFVQGRRTLARPEGGLGIGLALVKQLVEAHSGTVEAFSDGPGLGSTFVVTLPPGTGRPNVAPAVDLMDIVGDPRASVLVVDDNRDAADLAATVLADAGHAVDVAYSGLDALQRVAAAAPDVIVLDIGLPDLDGYEVALQLQARHPDRQFRLVALTGYGQSHDRLRSAAAGFAAHLVKPVDPLKLRAVVERIVAADAAPEAPGPALG